MTEINKRSKQVVDRKVQGALARRVIFHFCTFILLGAVLGLTMQFLSDPFTTFDQHCSQFWRNSGPQLAVLVLMLPVFVFDTLKLSNRIAGPVSRLRSTMEAVRKGQETADLKFRDGDYWQEMAGEFNDMVRELKKHEQTMAAQTRSVQQQEPIAV